MTPERQTDIAGLIVAAETYRLVRRVDRLKVLAGVGALAHIACTVSWLATARPMWLVEVQAFVMVGIVWALIVISKCKDQQIRLHRRYDQYLLHLLHSGQAAPFTLEQDTGKS